MTIYLDIVLIENLIMNTIIIYATSIIAKTKVKIIRVFVASLIGAIYSVFAYMSYIGIFSNIFLKILLSVVIIYIAFKPKSAKELCVKILLFYLVSFVFGGAAFAFIYTIKPQDIIMKNGLFLGIYTLRITLIGVIFGFVVMLIAFKIVKTRITKKDMYCNTKVVLNGKEKIVKTMIDTGNLLKEPISGNSVIVVEHVALKGLIPVELLDNIENILEGNFEKIEENIRQEYITKLKLIPYSSLGKENGMLLGIKADRIEVEYFNYEDNLNSIKEDVVIGLYNKTLTRSGEYNALIGIEAIES